MLHCLIFIIQRKEVFSCFFFFFGNFTGVFPPDAPTAPNPVYIYIYISIIHDIHDKYLNKNNMVLDEGTFLLGLLLVPSRCVQLFVMLLLHSREKRSLCEEAREKKEESFGASLAKEMDRNEFFTRLTWNSPSPNCIAST